MRPPARIENPSRRVRTASSPSSRRALPGDAGIAPPGSVAKGGDDLDVRATVGARVAPRVSRRPRPRASIFVPRVCLARASSTCFVVASRVTW